MKTHRVLLLGLLLALLFGCTDEPTADMAALDAGAEAVSLLGQPLHPMAMSEETQTRLASNLAEAQAQYNADPNNADNIIWLGRRLAYLWRYNDAVAMFTEGIEKHPNDARMYRHRGHRYITLRDFDKAITDFNRAVELIEGQPDEVEPDGAPNAYNIPTSTLQSNIWYHLGLAHYLKGDFESALAAYEACMNVSKNNDMMVATADWLYMTLRRLNRAEDATAMLAPIHADMEILENHAYHKRLLMYKGEFPIDSLLNPDNPDALELATQGYGAGNWYLYNGETETANDIFNRIVAGDYWAAFGHIAAEAELHRQ